MNSLSETISSMWKAVRSHHLEVTERHMTFKEAMWTNNWLTSSSYPEVQSFLRTVGTKTFHNHIIFYYIGILLINLIQMIYISYIKCMGNV